MPISDPSKLDYLYQTTYKPYEPAPPKAEKAPTVAAQTPAATPQKNTGTASQQIQSYFSKYSTDTTPQVASQKPSPIKLPNMQSATPTTYGTQPSNVGMEAGSQAMQQLQQYANTEQQRIIDNYNQDIALLRLKEDQGKSVFKNSDDVLGAIKAVEDSYIAGVTDPAAIASRSGVSRQMVDQVLRGDAFKSLQIQDWATENQRKDLEMQMKDLRTTRDRGIDDLSVKAEIMATQYNQQMDDIQQQSGIDQALMNKLGAASGAIQSSGYRMSMDMIRKEANKNIERLRQMSNWEKSEIATARSRLLEDFQENTYRIKDYYDRSMDQLRYNGLAGIQEVQAQFGVKTRDSVQALQSLYQDIERSKIDILNNTMQLQASFNDRRTQEIDLLEKYADQSNVPAGFDQFMQMYQENPAMAMQMFPEIAQEVNANAAVQTYGNTAAVRNFNPGNIKDSGFGNPTGKDDRGFATFSTAQEGFDALVQKIERTQAGNSKVYSPNMTLQEYFSVYAPAGDGANNPSAYANNVASFLGVTANTKISQLDPVKFAAAIAKNEDGNSYRMLIDQGVITDTGERGTGYSASVGDTGFAGIDYQDILDYNDEVTRRKMSEEDKNRIASQKRSVMSNPDSSIYDIMQWSMGGNTIGAEQSKQISKFDMAMTMIGQLQDDISSMKTGPIIGKLRSMNPWDTDAKILAAELKGLVPTVARGIYGEVGVLTDNDIRHYVQTLPNITNTKKQNELILAMNLHIFAEGYRSQLASLAGQGYDVSGLEGTYRGLMSEVEYLRNQVGMPPIGSGPDGQSQTGYGAGDMSQMMQQGYLPGIDDGGFNFFSTING